MMAALPNNPDLRTLTRSVTKEAKHKVSILVFEDDPIFRQLLERLLDKGVVDVASYESIGEFGSFSQIGRFDLVIVDCELPVMRGVEIASYIETFFPHVEVMLISAHENLDDQLKALHQEPPSCLRGFIAKSKGIDFIVKNIMKHVHRLNAKLEQSLFLEGV